MTLRDQIFAAQDIQTSVEDVPEWGCKLELRGTTARDRMALIQKHVDQDGNINLSSLYPDILVVTAHDPETGAKVFSPGDEDALSEKASAVVERLGIKAMSLSGMATGKTNSEGKPVTATDDEGKA